MAGSKIPPISACLLALLLTVIISENEAFANVGHPKEIFNRTDLVGAEGTNNNAKVVSVKKHKNYEIIVYEYDESGEKTGRSDPNKQMEVDGNGNVREVNDNSVEFPVVYHPTPPPPLSRRVVSNKPRVSAISTTRKTFTIPNPPKKEEEVDPLENSASEEVSTSVEASDEDKTPPLPSLKPRAETASSVSISSGNSKKSSTTTEKPQLPRPFRSTKAPAKKKVSSSSESDESDGEYDDDDYSDENDSSSKSGSRQKSFDESDEKNEGASSSSKKVGSSSKKPVPQRFGGDTEDDDYSDEDLDDYYSDEKIKPGSSKGKTTTTTTTKKPAKKPGAGKVTPKPFFPLIYDDTDEYEYDDDDDSSTTRKPSSVSSSSSKKKDGKPQSSQSESATKLNSGKKSKKGDDDDDSEADGAWGMDKSLKCKDPKGKRGICQEYSRCSIFYQELMDDYDEPIEPSEYKCRLPTQVGICCPIVAENDIEPEGLGRKIAGYKGISSTATRKQKRKVINPQVRRLIRTNLNNSLDVGDFFVEDLKDIEQDLLSRSVQVARNTPEFGHTRFFPTSKRIRQISNIGLSLLQTSNDISERLQLTNEIGGRGLKNFKSSNIEELNDRCPFQRPCRTSKYRTSDGSCNNLQKPKMGQSLTPLARILEPAYADGRWVPRISVRGFELPSARLLSQSFIKDRNFPDSRYTLLVMQFGQFLDHDLTSVPVFTFGNNSGINCCRNGQFLEANLRHPNCFPIEIPASDPFYSQYGQRCMNFVRSRMAPRIDCSLGYADQMNALTHWVDASNIYGSTGEQAAQLRLFQGGLLRFSELGDGKMLLPLRNVPGGTIDYRAGDDRVNEMQGLMIMHLVWFREHNRLAFELARLNPFWTDEELFQEARRILTAEYQHIIYNEWLPIIIGRKYMEKAGVVPLTKGYYKGYDPRIDGSIANAFSVAAFRMGHTLVQGLVRLIDEMGRDNEVSVISQNDVNRERTRQPNQVDKWLRGMAQQPIQSYDPFITEHLNGRLFQGSRGAFGMDLSSLNIQRSRDHGVPGYNFYRELCQVGRRAKTFDGFKDWIPPDTVDKMSLFYAHPDDVDLWIGGINERPLPGSLVGPTFACIIGDQFTRSKKGDRYYHDIGGQPHSFSPEQLREIRKVTFSRILCDNGDDLEALQPAAFLQADFDFNSLVDCKRSTRIPRMNLRLWQKEPTPIV